MTDKVTIVRYAVENEKFEIIVKPDPALDLKMGKPVDISNVLVSDEIYSDANKGTRASTEKLLKFFKTKDQIDIARQILAKGEINLTTDQRRKMIEEKKKQIVQYINKNFVDPKTHLPHPITRIENAMEEVRLVIDPFKRSEEQAKGVIDALRKILPLKSEIIQIVITVPASYSAQSYSFIKSIGNFKNENWLADGSLQVLLEINAGIKGNIIERLGSITKGSAQITEK